MDRVQIAEIYAIENNEVEVLWLKDSTLESFHDLRTAENNVFSKFHNATVYSKKLYPGILFVSQEIPEATVYVQGSTRIGHGTKLHRARKDSKYGIRITCRCPGTQNGNASNKATFFPGVEANCGN